ncbi:AAA family ATPase [Dactylosporangium sp. CA-139066]|uniref:AAA family ATPase n=1 Tax=Dactylosporangium sp. CA-139066 TaxID=3239930 RepID=UPI003D8C07FA
MYDQLRDDSTQMAVGKIEQDQFRRVVLREHGGLGADAVAPGFIDMSARYLLSAGYHVIVEGILDSRSYGTVLRQLIAEHPGPSHVYYLDVSFDETIRRHRGRAEPIPVSAEEMRGWYVPLDVLGVSGEHVIPETSTFEQTVATILDISGLAGMAPATPCPTRCARCDQKRTEDQNAMPATAGLACKETV